MIVNTVQFRFPPGSPRPSWAEIARFLKELNTDVLTMEAAYRTANDRSIFIKFTSQEAMMESLNKNTEPRKFHYISGISIEVRMTEAGNNVRYVRVFDLPPELSDCTLSTALERYGKVERIVREKFSADLGLPHMHTGVRGVYMDIKQDIPPEIIVGNRKGRIYFDGLQDTCFMCRAIGHRKDSCPQRKSRKHSAKKDQRVSPISYASVVSGQEPIAVEEESAEFPEEIIEVLEEEDIEEETEATDTEITKATEPEKNIEQQKEERRKESWEKLGEMARAISDAVIKQQASQRRAQFAATGSKEHSRPKKLCARKTNY